jgi:hypothetical protein
VLIGRMGSEKVGFWENGAVIGGVWWVLFRSSRGTYRQSWVQIVISYSFSLLVSKSHEKYCTSNGVAVSNEIDVIVTFGLR